jgi:hypothetical protein
MHFRNTTGVFEGLELFVDDPKLHLPLGNPFVLPDFSFNNQGSVSQNYDNLSTGLLDFFGDFAPTPTSSSQMDFTLETTNGGWRFKLRDGKSVNLLPFNEFSTASLKAFEVSSNGHVSGTVDGSLGVMVGLKHYVAESSWSLSKDGGDVKLSTSQTVDLGFASMAMNVWMKSNGTFEFEGQKSFEEQTVEDPITGSSAGEFSGELNVTINNSGFSASATGSLSLLGFGLFEDVSFGINGDGSFTYNGVTCKFP